MTILQAMIGLTAIAVTVAIYSLTRMISTEHRMTTLETKIDLFWKLVERGTLDILHHPDRIDLDAMIDKRKTEPPLTASETQDYLHKLQHMIQDDALSPGERTAATLALACELARHHEPPRKSRWRFW